GHTGCRLAFSSFRLTVASSLAMPSSSEESSSSVEKPCSGASSSSESSASSTGMTSGSASGAGAGLDFLDFFGGSATGSPLDGDGTIGASTAESSSALRLDFLSVFLDASLEDSAAI
ncbi:hypothetical protein B0H14DRAFT_2665886, partial [Mycena olivaceomarginata]